MRYYCTIQQNIASCFSVIVKYNNNDSYSSPVPPTMVPLLSTTVPLLSITVPLLSIMVPLKKKGCHFLPDSCRSKAVVQHNSSPVAPIPSAKIDRSTILVIKNSIRCCRNGCPMGCNGKPVAKLLELSKCSPKLSKLMNPLHFQQWPLGQQRPATAEKTG